MSRRILTMLAITSLGLVLGVDRASALNIPVNCGGNAVGNITVNVANGGIRGGFTSTVGGPPPTQAAAAAACNEDHFNWYQIVTADNNPPVDAGGNRLAAPYVDPPPGGYGNDPNTGGDDTQWGDRLPWYWDEGADPPAGTPGFQDGLNVADNTAGATLSYADFPGGLPNTNLSFSTWLVSLNANGSFHSWHPGFSWDWSNSTGTNTAGNLARLAPIPVPPTLLLFLSALVTAFAHAWRSAKRTGTEADQASAA
jgi:hypothetical protein